MLGTGGAQDWGTAKIEVPGSSPLERCPCVSNMESVEITSKQQQIVIRTEHNTRDRVLLIVLKNRNDPFHYCYITY